MAAGLLVLALLESAFGWGLPDVASRWAQAALAVAWTIPLIWRRRRPVPVFVVVILCGPLYAEINLEGGLISFVLAAMLSSYTVGRHTDPPATWLAPSLCLGLSSVGHFAFREVVDLRLLISDIVFITLLYGGAWLVGFTLRRRERRIDVLAREAGDARADAARRELEATAAERARIARELHDVVTHSISVVTIQTQAVRRRLARHGESTAAEVADLAAIETTSRQAMADLRRLLGVLRAQDPAVSLQPQPGLDQLPRLVEGFRAAGLAVHLDVSDHLAAAPPGVDLATYRVVQEALTNVLRHAPGATATVTLRRGETAISVEVIDDGPAGGRERVDDGSGGGHGLVGMRERVALYGGTLQVGPAARGFAVRATLPVAETTLTAASDA